MTKSDDAHLLERWRTARDGDAFAELARRHVPVVFDLAARTLGDRTAAEDVVQEALLDLALEETARPAEVGVVAWLARFAICRARNKRSSERSRARRQQVVGLRRPEEAMPDDELERKEELEHALAAAQPEERAVLAMRFLHGWEYDRIASALSTTEGAARVRVHRALSAVRGRLGVGREDAAVTSGLAAMAFVPMSPMWMSGAISSAIDGAMPPVNPAPMPGLTSALRASVLGAGAMLVLGAAAVLAPSSFDGAGARPGSYAGVEVASANAAATTRGVDGARGASGAAASDGTAIGARPQDWDDGALERLARGESSASSSAPAAPPAPAADAVPPQAPAAPADAPADPQTSGAFRPDQRGASAANCDSGPSDDGRADAPGGFVRPAVVETAERPATDARDDAAPDEPIRLTPSQAAARAAATGRAFEDLDASERALVEEAAALVRETLARASATASLGDATRVRRDGERTVRRQVREWRRHTSPGDRMSAKKAAKLSRLVSALVDFALAGGGDAGTIRWPDGVDVATAMAELIRVLEAASAGQVRAPDIASPPAPDRLPELE